MRNGKEVKYKIRQRKKVPLTYNDYGPYETKVYEYEVSYDEYMDVLKKEVYCKEHGYASPDTWTVRE